MKHPFGAMALVMSLLVAACTGCTSIDNADNSRSAIQITETIGEETAAPKEATTETDPTAIDADDTESETNSGASIAAEETAPANTTAVEDSASETNQTDSETAQWIETASAMYESAISVYNTYLCSSDGFTYETDENSVDGWMHVTSCDTLEAAVQPYFDVFAVSQHSGDLDGQFQMIDDKLYRLCGDRGLDITYVSSEITALTDRTEDCLTFTVVSTYCEPYNGSEDGVTTEQTDVFTLVLEDGQWKVGTFTMPC